ncbi:MAG: zinc-dependent alcohol dehydrogenase [Bryobacteraceae bacterium]
MKSVQLVAPRTMEVCEMSAPPDPGPGEVMVRVRAVGICGSDMHWYLEGCIGAHAAVYPQVLGHEPAGEIVAVGRGVESVRAGQKVAIEPAITCGCCELCRSGRHNNCLTSIFMGTPQMPGLFRELAVVPARNVVAAPEHMGFVEATLIEPLAVILHILELTEIRLGDTVAVLGAGPIGLLTAAVARIAGASRVFVGDKVAHRVDMARNMGACAVNMREASFVEAVRDQTSGRGVDVVFDAAAAAETMDAAIAVARSGGRVVLIGIPAGRHPRVDVHAAMAKELSLHTVKRSNHNAHGAIELLESGRIDWRLITHRYGLEQTPHAFETLAEYADGVGKAVIEIPA